MANFFNLLTTATLWKYTHMNIPFESLDKAITYLKNIIVSADGTVTWSTGTLTWSDTLRIHFNTAAGLACLNTIAAGNIAISDGEFAYVDLSETNNAALTVSKASVTTGSVSNFLAYNRIVLGYRNAASDEYYPVYMPLKNAASIGGHTIQDEGASKTARTYMDFVGAGVTVTDDAGADKSVVTIPGAGDVGKKSVELVIFDFATDVAVGEGKFYFIVPDEMNGMNLVRVAATVITAGTTNTTTVAIRNVTDSQEMLSANMAIETGETSTRSSATPGTIDTAHDDVATGDVLAIDVDAVSTTAPKGLIIEMVFQLP
jgi:hypothetical protein